MTQALRGRLRWALCASAAAFFGVVSRAGADPASHRLASLAWIRKPGAEQCIGPMALSEEVAKKLGREAITAPSRASLAIEGHIERVDSDGGWRATLAVVSETGEVQGLRELHGTDADCRSLDESLALVIALLIEPGAILAPIPHAVEAPPSVTLSPPPPPVFPGLPLKPVVAVSIAPPPLAPSASSPPAQRWVFDGGVGVVGGVGLLPGPLVPGLALRARLKPPRWPAIELDGAFWTPRSSGTPGASFALGWGALSICPLVLAAGADVLSLCVGGAFAGLVAETAGLSPAATKARFVFYPQAAFRYERRLFGPLTASAGLGMVVPTDRAVFYYLDRHGARQDVFQQAPVACTFDLGLGVRLP
jgi:hypothetical protein